MTLFKRPCPYSKIHKEDPEELLHQRAKFLIYKNLQEVDLISRRDHRCSAFIRVKLYLLKVEIGKSLNKMCRNVVNAVRFGGIRKCSQGGVTAFKKLFRGGASTGISRPIFALEV